MIKKIKVKKEFTLDELLEDIFNDTEEIYEVEVEEDITEDMVFENLIWFDLKGNIHISRESSIARIIAFNDLCKEIYVYHNDEFSKIWERDSDE